MPEIIKMPGLILVPATFELADAEMNDLSLLERQLSEIAGRVTVPEDWPPESLKDALFWFREQLRLYPERSGWYTWYGISGEGNSRILSASAGFKGLPDELGTADIGYSVLPGFQKRGIAVKMVNALLRWAFSHPGVKRIAAETFHDNLASITVLMRNGFLLDDKSLENQIWRYYRDKDI